MRCIYIHKGKSYIDESVYPAEEPYCFPQGWICGCVMLIRVCE